jgi:hypothetical protein
LRDYGVLKSSDQIKGKKDLSDLLDRDNVNNDVDQETATGKHHTFTFVGLILLDRFVFECYPKYLSLDLQDRRQLAQILKVLERCEAREQSIRAFGEWSKHGNNNLLGTMVFLLRDYFEQGPYRNSIRVTEINGTGEIAWDRTIDRTLPFLSHGRPLYPNLYTHRRSDDPEDFFHRLHKTLLTQCSRELRDAGLSGLIDIPHVVLSEEPLVSFGEPEYVQHTLERELNQQFDTRKRYVLNAMLAYLSKKASLSDSNIVSTFGSNSFNLVWERVCADVIGNHLNVPISALPLSGPLGRDYEPSASLQSLIDKPKWAGTDRAGSFSLSATETLKPDCASIVQRGEHLELLILDAKYYAFRLNRDENLSNQPGVADVSKQYLYQLALKGFVEDHDIVCVRNCFLMPTEESEIRALGHVSMGFFRDLGLSDIQLLLLPAPQIYDLYLKGARLDPHSIVVS